MQENRRDSQGNALTAAAKDARMWYHTHTNTSQQKCSSSVLEGSTGCYIILAVGFWPSFVCPHLHCLTQSRHTVGTEQSLSLVCDVHLDLVAKCVRLRARNVTNTDIGFLCCIISQVSEYAGVYKYSDVTF
jgi:hypothetical protein